MSANNSKTSNDPNLLNHEGSAQKENWIVRYWKKLPYFARTVLPPITLFAFILFVIIIVSYRAKLDITVFLGVLSSAVSIYTALLAFLTWLNVQKLQYSVPKSPTSAGNHSAILVLGVGMDIWGNVEAFCSGDSNFTGIMKDTGFKNAKLITDINERIKDTSYSINIPIPEKRIINVNCPAIEEKEYESDTEKILNDPIRRLYKVFNLINSALHENGISELYIFYGGPVFIPFFLGEIFSNNYTVNIYQRPRTNEKTYKYVGVMDHLLYH